ncbi:hypothetical protein NEF87_003315 [Candidatus Lokiarchaeum ossiferum]|uniref:DUF3795 domain-containing protein n=1 Tax=Candidatus Lokiarchaeum ossiferum TaxID=2951803 RepID=A0ABY6HUD1_9ARCH|nr:hypothetical protein NEF87_003315 [Candidatus Lokiarchaeum sp. B-35]
MKKIGLRPLDSNIIGYCGVFCGGCPSYHVGNCHGCRSVDTNQKRISKWKCRKRLCCLEKDIYSCGDCSELIGCRLRKPLIKSYLKKYNLNLDQNAQNLALKGNEEWLIEQRTKYLCPQCGGVMSPYELRCIQCGSEN